MPSGTSAGSGSRGAWPRSTRRRLPTMRARGTRVDSQGNEKGQLSNVKESIEGEGGHNRNGCFRQGVEAHTKASPGPPPETLRGQQWGNQLHRDPPRSNTRNRPKIARFPARKRLAEVPAASF